MPEKTTQNYYKNPFAVPEPYYLPGYTGHCPLYKNIIGQSYGWATHNLMEKETCAPGRLKTLPEAGHWQLKDPLLQEDVDILEERTLALERAILTKNITPGYQGHIPRVSDMIGLNFNKSCIKAVAEFEKRRRRLEELLQVKAPS